MSNKAKPLLVIEYNFVLNSEQLAILKERVSNKLNEAGWHCIIVDAMSHGRATAYMPHGGNVKPIDMDKFEEWLRLGMPLGQPATPQGEGSTSK